LFYSDGVASYRVKSLTVQECGGCSPSDPETAVYGAATVTSDEQRTVLGAPGELVCRLPLDPAKTYTVSIDGENVSGGFNLLVGKDGAFSWVGAPNGVKSSRVLHDALPILLFYSDGVASYRVKSLTVQECGGCSPSDPETAVYGAATV